MPLSHFKAKHFGSKSLSLLGHIGAAAEQFVEYLHTIARRFVRR